MSRHRQPFALPIALFGVVSAGSAAALRVGAGTVLALAGEPGAILTETKGPPLRTTYILVDFENVQPAAIGVLDQSHVKVLVFVGDYLRHPVRGVRGG